VRDLVGRRARRSLVSPYEFVFVPSALCPRAQRPFFCGAPPFFTPQKNQKNTQTTEK
jgi:hypothetical protein